MSGRPLRLLLFPEYAYPCNHPVVETVYERLLPEMGYDIHTIRPGAVGGLTRTPPPWSAGSQILFPDEPLGSAFRNVARAARRTLWVRSALRVVEREHFDLVLVRNDLLYAAAARREARRRGIPFVFQVSSPDAEFRLRAARGKALTPAGLYGVARGKLDLIARRRLCRAADAVLAISDAMAQHMVEREGVAADKVFSFPMGVATPSDPATRKTRAELGLPEGPLLVYSGTIERVRQPLWMVDVAAKVRERIPDAALLVIAKETGELRDELERYGASLGVPLYVIGPLHHSAVPEYLRSCDVMLSPIPPIFEYRVSSPTKVFEAMAEGVPVVANGEILDQKNVLDASGGGRSAPYDPSAFADAVVAILRDPLRREMGERGRSWVTRMRPYSMLTSYLDRILRALCEHEDLRHLRHSPDTFAAPVGRSSVDAFAQAGVAI